MTLKEKILNSICSILRFFIRFISPSEIKTRALVKVFNSNDEIKNLLNTHRVEHFMHSVNDVNDDYELIKSAPTIELLKLCNMEYKAQDTVLKHAIWEYYIEYINMLLKERVNK